LPSDIQAIIDDLSLKYCERRAEYFDQNNTRIKEALVASGGEIIN
jgi:TRAP-type C4-dicarboxylate transport system substrate-binding protein